MDNTICDNIRKSLKYAYTLNNKELIGKLSDIYIQAKKMNKKLCEYKYGIDYVNKPEFTVEYWNRQLNHMRECWDD